MSPRHIFMALAVSGLTYACRTTGGDSAAIKETNVTPTELGEQEVTTMAQVAGYSFSGPENRDGLAPGIACAQVATLEGAACEGVQGKTYLDSECQELCSNPIAPKGKIAGFSFAGFRIREGLAPGVFCTLTFTVESAACDRLRGKVAFTSSCSMLCSLPIAPKNKVAGFNFDGFQRRNALLPGHACAQASSAALAVTDACEEVRGRTVYDQTCNVLCSRPVAPKQPSASNVDGDAHQQEAN